MTDTPPKPSPHLSLPQHLRPPVSRQVSSTSNKSNSSSRSRPHHQNEFMPTTTGIPDLVGAEGLEEDDVDPGWGLDGTHESENEQESSEEDWNAIREGSISRRPAWRRPRPMWIYPFIIGVATSLGMSMAPRAELFINLACLAHPPRQPSSMVELITLNPVNVNPISVPTWQGDSIGDVNATLPSPTIPSKKPLSPADEWFLKLQRDIYEYHRSHRQPQVTSHPSSTTATKTYALPSGPLPQPTTPSESSTPSSPPHRHERPETEDSPPYRAIDPALCKKDPAVQAAAARLTMTMTFTMGALAALTAGYWGQTSDRIGRTKIMAIVEVGLLISEISFILVATFPYLAPGGYRALLIGPTVDGLLGGFATMGATMHAYVSDTTADGSRATAFAKLGGILMSGFAVGPALGALLISVTGNIMVPFYVNVCIHALWIPLMIFLLPESLSTEARQHLAKTAKLAKEARKRRNAAQREWEDEEDDPAEAAASGWSRISTGNTRRSRRFRGNTKRAIRKVFKFLQPLAIFLPKQREDGRPGNDYNFTAIGSGLFFISMLIGVYSLKAQYSFYAYGWTAAQLGPYMSLIGFSRGFMLIVVVPAILKRVKPRYTEVSTSEEQVEPSVVGPSTSTNDPQVLSNDDEPTTSHTTVRTAELDLMVARISLAIELVAYIALSFGPPALVFVAVTAFSTFGSAAAPAAKSLALSQLPSKREAGRLFGALSVADALGGTLLAPLLFGTLFSSTVGWYAPSIFILASLIIALAQFCLAFVRLDDGRNLDGESGRGRSQKVKRVKSKVQIP